MYIPNECLLLQYSYSNDYVRIITGTSPLNLSPKSQQHSFDVPQWYQIYIMRLIS